MNTICIHIDEALDAPQMEVLKTELLEVPHIHNVEVNPDLPHDMLVEFDAHYDMPMTVLQQLSQHGLHPDIMYC
jgi:hypothetical protein